MNKSNLITVTAISLFMISTTACSEGDHHHGEGHHHEKSHGGHHGHDDHHSDDDHHAGKAGNYESVPIALATLKTALADTEAAFKANKLDAVHEMFPKIEASAAFLHDNAAPKSEALAERLHTAIDQLMELVTQMHDASHGMDKDSASRMLKKLNGSLQLVEAYMSTSEAPSSNKPHGDHDH